MQGRRVQHHTSFLLPQHIEFLERRQLLAAAPLAAFADFNGDGRADLILANRNAGDGAAGAHVTIQTGVGDGTFAAPGPALDLAAAPRSVAMGDLTQDGNADIVVAAKGKGGAAIRAFVALPGGTFAPANSTVATKAVLFKVADVNGDGRGDLVGFGKRAVDVALGNGDGTFAPAVPTQLPADFGPAAAAGDVNGDGRSDLVGFSGGVGRLALGNADGTFAPATDVDLGLGARKEARGKFGVATGDVTGDGAADITLLPAKKGVPVFVAAGAGNGTFGTAADGFVLTPSIQPDFVGPGFSTKGLFPLAVAQIDNDGGVDLIGFAPKASPSAPIAFVALDNGKGFGRPIFATSINTKSALTFAPLAGDFNGDGRSALIIAMADRVGRGTLRIQTSLGNGIFDDPFFVDPFGGANTLARGSTAQVFIGDATGEGRDDTIVIEIPRALDLNDLIVSTTPSLGNGSFGPTVSRSIDGNAFLPDVASLRPVVVDLTGDGKDDLLFAAGIGFPALDGVSAPVSSLYASITDGTSHAVPFQFPASPFGSSVQIASLATGDLNGDQVPDLVGFGPVVNNALNAYLALGDGSVRLTDNSVRFNAATQVTLALPAGATLPAGAQPLLADVNGDGRSDVIAVSHEVVSTGTPSVSSPAFVALANADGSLAPASRASNFISPAGERAFVGDVNGDGRADLLSLSTVKAASAPVVFTLARSDGTFGQKVG